MLDLGTSDYITPYKALFVSFIPCRIRVGLPNGRNTVTKGFSDIVLNFINNKSAKITEITLRKV